MKYNWTKLILTIFAIFILISALVILILIRIYNLELSTESRGDKLYLFYFLSLPIAVFTLFSMRHNRLKDLNWVDVFFGLLILVFVFIGGFFITIQTSDTWVTDTILFESKHGNAQIVEETKEYGVFGNGGYRTVEKEEFFYYFYEIKYIRDIESIDLKKWTPINKVIRGA